MPECLYTRGQINILFYSVKQQPYPKDYVTLDNAGNHSKKSGTASKPPI